MDVMSAYQTWLDEPFIDEQTKSELRGIAEDHEEITDRFSKTLQFGTGGLRGKIGAGSNRMNIYTVRLATQALANVLHAKKVHTNGVVIAYDTRRMSKEFAEEAARVLVGNEIPVYIFAEIAPTPLLSFAVRHLKAAGGIVVTASHNPVEYNGYKAYDSAGVQLLEEDALRISDQTARIKLKDVKVSTKGQESNLWKYLGESLYEQYYQKVQELSPGQRDKANNLSILFTPLHGTGAKFVPEVLRRAGFNQVSTVAEQMVPDGEFPTVKLPNPEEADSFRLGFAQAGEGKYDLITATDPDADRVGVAVWHGGKYELLNGNQVGVLLSDFLLSQVPVEERTRAVVIKTIVTTEMIMPIARKYGVEVLNTLTGFKYIGNLIGELEVEGRQFLFGFEESYGYLAGTFVRDKDAVLATLLVAQMAAEYKSQGMTLFDRLEQLYKEHQYYREGLRSYSFKTSTEAEKAKAFIESLRKESIKQIGGEEIRLLRDFGRSVELDLFTAEEQALDFPKEEVIQWITTAGSKITLRPSGTEPKMKLYIGVIGKSADESETKLRTMETAFDMLVSEGLGS